MVSANLFTPRSGEHRDAPTASSISRWREYPPPMDPLEIEAGEADIEDLLDALENGQRVIIKTEFLGGSHEVTLRYDDFWYCDTPTRLHKHKSRSEMRECLERQGYAQA